MKRNYFLAAALLIFTVACEKELLPPQDSSGEPEIVVKQVTESLADQDNLSLFVEAFESLEMSTEDIAEGITIFAPVDNALKDYNASVSSNAKQARATSTSDTTNSELTPEVLKDHIVKGIIKAADLSHGDKLTTLSGNQLEVMAEGDDILVNGILLSGKNIATNEKYVVHTVAKVLSNAVPQDSTGTQDNPATIEVTVWNGTKWAPGKSTGEKEAGVTVSLYNSQEEYAQGQVAYTQETGADGKATFTELDPGKLYYIEAKKDDLSNIFYKSAQIVNWGDGDVYLGMFPEGIFQSQEEVDSYAQQPDAMPGNFRWKDINADGRIDSLDRVSIPHKKVEAVSSQTTQIEVIIGYNNNEQMDPAIGSREEALQLLGQIYYDLDRWQEFLVMADGMLSDDADCGNMMNWCEIDNFSFNSTNTIFTMLWQDGYKNISQLNLLLRDVPGLTFAEQIEVIAQAKGLRAYIYLQLLTYFGDIPLQTGLGPDKDAVRSSGQEVYDFIVTDLEAAVATLPEQWSSDKGYQLNSGAGKVLLAKAALWKKDYNTVAQYTNEVLQSGRYQLMANDTLVFADAGNAEIIWDFSYASPDLSPWFSDYFYGRSFYPTARLAEVYLMNAEAQFQLGATQEALNSMNIIRDRMGMPPAISSEELSTTWKAAMPREGNRFANLVRWEKANEVLSPKGYNEWHSLLPVPQIFLDSHPNLMQNPGY